LDFSQVGSKLKAVVGFIRREFLPNFWRFFDLSPVDFQVDEFLISEDENSVDFDSRMRGHFRGGREKGETFYVVVFIEVGLLV